MTTGTKIVKGALSRIGAHSVIAPANPESINEAKDILNSMLAEWYDSGIDMSTVPLNAVGDDLSEPLGARNAIIDNLAILCKPLFEGAVISPELSANALKGLSQIKRTWKPIVIPKAQVRDTLPKGQGNRGHGWYSDAYFKKGDELG